MDDIGLLALNSIHQVQQIDEPWTTRADRQFSWIGHRLQQTVSASKILEDDGLYLSRLTAKCVVVEGVAAADEDVLRLLCSLNCHVLGNAYSYSHANRRITATAVAYVHKETLDWRTNQFGAFSLQQLCIAETEADYIAEKVGGQVSVREHPANGLRADRDEMLDVIDVHFARDGVAPSLFANEFEMQTVAEISSKSSTFASFGASDKGVALEMAFAEDTSLGRLKTEEPHRRIGNGLCFRLHLPLKLEPEEAGRIAATLNREEMLGSALTTHYGAWCWDEWPTVGHALAYQAFFPNSIYRPGIAQDAAYSLVKRALWVDRFLNAQPSKNSVWATIAERYGASAENSEED